MRKNTKKTIRLFIKFDIVLIILLQKPKTTMKRAYLLLSFILGLLALNSNAQNVSLRVDSILGIPDTVYPGQVVSYSVVLKNNGFIPYQGPLQLAMDNGQGQIAYLYFSATPVLVLPGSTYTVSGATVTIDSSFFRPGGNVVVVWPYTSQLIAYTPKVFNTYVMNNFQGVEEVPLTQIVSVFPNPTSDFIQIKSGNRTIERVRIYDINGKLVYQEQNNDGASLFIYVGDLPVGIYSVEMLCNDEKAIRQIIIK